MIYTSEQVYRRHGDAGPLWGPKGGCEAVREGGKRSAIEMLALDRLIFSNPLNDFDLLFLNIMIKVRIHLTFFTAFYSIFPAESKKEDRFHFI